MTKIFRSQVKDIPPRFKFGVEILCNYRDALCLDEKNKNQLFIQAIQKGKDQLFDYETFNVLEREKNAPKGYKRIPGFFVFDVKHDLRRKARFDAGGHMTTAPEEEIYSGVVDHKNVRITLFLS